MSTTNRASLLNKTHKVLKKHYKPQAKDERPLLEVLIFAGCLENAQYSAAEKAFATLSNDFFDWNEVRVTTKKELSEVLSMLPDSMAGAERVKRVLQSVFEKLYSFEMEDLRKQNLGKAVKQLEAFDGTTPFMVAYATQMALGGHKIPLDQGALDALLVVGVVTPAEVAKQAFGSIERAISKTKGIEFGSLLHQLGADFVASPYSTNLHKTLLEIDSGAKSRLPKRGGKKEADTAAAPKSRRKKAVSVKAKTSRASSSKAKAPKAKPKAKKAKRATKAAKATRPAKKKVAKKKAGKKKPR